MSRRYVFGMAVLGGAFGLVLLHCGGSNSQPPVQTQNTEDAGSNGFDANPPFDANPGNDDSSGDSGGPVMDAGNGMVVVSPASLSFGLVPCPVAYTMGGDDGGTVSITEGDAGAAASQAITITNQGVAQYKLTLGLGTSSPYILTNSTGAQISLGMLNSLNNGITTINVVPLPVKRPASTVSDGLADTLTITTTSATDTPHVIPLHQTAQGAVLGYTPSDIATSDHDSLHTTFDQFTIANTGNYTVNYRVSVATTPVTARGGSFTLNLPAAGSLQQLFGGAMQTGELEVASNGCSCNVDDAGIAGGCGACIGDPPQLLGFITVAPENGSVLCSDPPPVMPLSEN